MSSGPASPPDPGSRRSLGTWLLAAVVTLALLPALTGLPGWLAARDIQAPLERVATVVTEFGRHDRAFRANVRGLYAALFVTRNFEDRESFEQTRDTIRRHLDAMRAAVAELAASNVLGSDADFRPAQARIDGFTERYLALVDRKLTAEERRNALSASIAADALAMLAGLPDGYDRLRNQLLNLADLARQAGGRLAANEIDTLRDEFERTLTTAEAQARSLPDGPAAGVRERLERAAAELNGDGGLFATLEDLARLGERELSDRLALRGDVIGLIESLVAIDEANDSAASELLRASAAQLQSSYEALAVSVTLGTIGALAFVVLFIQGNLLRRLRALIAATRRIRRGELDEPVERQADDELGELAGTLEAARLAMRELHLHRDMLAARTEELELLNQELDRFAYVASHDLKAPLRAVSSLLGFLREDLEGVVTEDAETHLDMIEGRIARLTALLDSLLEYSRAGRKREPVEEVDLRTLIETASDVVRPASGQVVLRGDFGPVSICRAPLEQVVRNLVDNAFKHGAAEGGRVTVECDVGDGQLRLDVVDEGPGIAVEHHERVFAMFQTLKPRDQVEGSGMGLAILKRLVDSHGGRIALESDPANRPGTRFVVEWPLGESPAIASEADAA